MWNGSLYQGLAHPVDPGVKRLFSMKNSVV